MPTWTVTAHTPTTNGYAIGGCIEVGDRLYVLWPARTPAHSESSAWTCRHDTTTANR
jgi:hypothetical protein